MQSLRSVRNTQLGAAAKARGSLEPVQSGDPNRSIQRLKELIRAITLVAETAEQSLVSEFKFGEDFYDNVSRFEIIMIKRALQKAEGNQRKAAQLLGLKPTTLNSKIKRYGVRAVT